MSPVLQIDGLSVAYGRRLILTDVSLQIEAGSSASVVGRSGSGKSSLLSAILGMVDVANGSILVDGVDAISVRGAARRSYLRDTVSIVFQRGELLDELEPLENVAIAALLAGYSRDEAFDRARNLLDQVEVRASGITTSVLSGGEYQRVAVARALITEPKLVLADEPTGSLDVEYRDLVADVVFSIPEISGSALLVVTHDPYLASRADASYALETRAGAGGRLEPVT